MKQTVIGFYDTIADAQQAVDHLLRKGFEKTDVDISSTDSLRRPNNRNDFNLDNEDDRVAGTYESDESGITRFFKNLFGSDDNDVDRYTKVARSTDAIVTVYTDSRDDAEKAADILDEYGAVDVDDRASDSSYDSRSRVAPNNTLQDETADRDVFDNNAALTGTTITDPGMLAASIADEDNTDRRSLDDDENRRMENVPPANNFLYEDRHAAGEDVEGNANRSVPIIEESFEVGKKKVQTGGVRLRSHIVERPVQEELRLRQEHITVERNTVNREATPEELQSFKEGEIEMIENSEVPVVNKQARVVEEITLNKEVEERSETIQDTVRKTEVDIEEIRGNRNDTRAEGMVN